MIEQVGLACQPAAKKTDADADDLELLFGEATHVQSISTQGEWVRVFTHHDQSVVCQAGAQDSLGMQSCCRMAHI